MIDEQREKALVEKTGSIIGKSVFLLPKATLAFSKFCNSCKNRIVQAARKKKIVVMEDYCKSCQGIAKHYLGGLK